MGRRNKGRKPKKVSRLTTEEEKSLATYLEISKFSKKWRPILSVLIDTGVRVGELSALRWKHIDFENNVIYVENSLAYGKSRNGKCRYMLGSTKTAAGNRKIVMTENVKEILLNLKKAAEEENIKSSIKISGHRYAIFTHKKGRLLCSYQIC